MVLASLTVNLTGYAAADNNKAAPIRYMGANAGASVSTYSAAPRTVAQNRPYISQHNYVSPRAITPRPVVRPEDFKSPVFPQDKFHARKVDKDLYMHQKVGRPYRIAGKSYTPKHNPNYDETGTASWYGPSYYGKLTANGETFDMNGLTAAHKTLPLNSLVHVTNLENGKTITVRLNDRGPFVEGREIDLSMGAAKVLGITGLAKVRVQYAGPADPMASQYVQRDNSKPVIATPAPMPKVQPKAPMTANLGVPTYKPLSVIPHTPMAMPTPQNVSGENVQSKVPEAFDFSAPSAPMSSDIAPLRPAETKDENRPAQDFTAPEGGVMTLTITGPIHMASADTDHGARFIPAVHRGEATTSSEMPASARYIQAAAFSSMDRAESIRHSLSAIGTFSVSEIERNGRPLYRVLVGPFASQADADAAQNGVATLGYTDARIIEMY